MEQLELFNLDSKLIERVSVVVAPLLVFEFFVEVLGCEILIVGDGHD